MGDYIYARNYGHGPKWLPGLIVKIEGAVLYHVKLKDDRVLRRHRDQLRLRLADPADKGPGEESGPDTGPQMARSKLTDQETVTDSQAQLSTPETDTRYNPEPESSGPQLAEQQPESDEPVSNSTATHDPIQEPSEESPENGSTTQPITLRRSSRTRNPPLRYGELVY